MRLKLYVVGPVQPDKDEPWMELVPILYRRANLSDATIRNATEHLVDSLSRQFGALDRVIYYDEATGDREITVHSSAQTPRAFQAQAKELFGLLAASARYARALG